MIFTLSVAAVAASSIYDGMCNLHNPCFESAEVSASCSIDEHAPIVGPMICSCPPGWVGDGKKGGTGCQDLNECNPQDGSEPLCAGEGELCTNKKGTYDCKCAIGYMARPNGETGCVDINECSRSNSCDPLTTVCRNLPGTYECVCSDPTHIVDPFNRRCRPFNLCLDKAGAYNPCDESRSHCSFNPDNGASCICNKGYQPSPSDGNKCIDINECDHLHECPPLISICENTPGSYTCICDEVLGYTQSLTEPHRRCINLNECEKWPNVCPLEQPCCKDLEPEYPPKPFNGYKCGTIDDGLPSGFDFIKFFANFDKPQLTGSEIQNQGKQPPLIGGPAAPGDTLMASLPWRPGTAARVDGIGAIKYPAAKYELNFLPRRLAGVQQWSDFTAILTKGSPLISNAANKVRDSMENVFAIGRCPSGWVNTIELQRRNAFERAVNLLGSTMNSAWKVAPPVVARGIAENAQLLVNDLSRVTSGIAANPADVGKFVTDLIRGGERLFG